MYPTKSVQAVLLISVDVELCFGVSSSGEGFLNLLRSNLYSTPCNKILVLTSCDCIDVAV